MPSHPNSKDVTGAGKRHKKGQFQPHAPDALEGEITGQDTMTKTKGASDMNGGLGHTPELASVNHFRPPKSVTTPRESQVNGDHAPVHTSIGNSTANGSKQAQTPSKPRAGTKEWHTGTNEESASPNRNTAGGGSGNNEGSGKAGAVQPLKAKLRADALRTKFRAASAHLFETQVACVHLYVHAGKNPKESTINVNTLAYFHSGR